MNKASATHGPLTLTARGSKKKSSGANTSTSKPTSRIVSAIRKLTRYLRSWAVNSGTARQSTYPRHAR